MKFLVFIILFSFNLFAQTKTLLIEEIRVLTVNSIITPATLNYLEAEIKKEQKENLLFVIKLNTPGGLVTTTKEILTLIGSSISPIAVWVTPEGASATSAGAIIASSSHFLFMNEGTNIGAATPIGLGEDIKESDSRNKAVNDLVALVRSLSTLRGRNADAFALMIEKANSYSSDEALKKNIINGLAHTLNQIQTQINGKEIFIKGEKKLINFAPVIETKEIKMDLGQDLLNIFSHPTTAYILFMLGAALLYFEFQAPGGYISGSIGVICLLLAGIGFQVLPLNVGAIALMILGIILLILEIFITSYGILTIGGIASLTGGSLFLFRTENSFLTIEYPFILSTLFGLITFIILIGWYLMKHKKKAQLTSFFKFHNHEGIVLNSFSDGIYQIKVAGEIWKAKSKDELSIQDKVVVQGQDENQLLLYIAKK